MIALLRTLYLLTLAGLSALTISALALQFRWRWRHRKVQRVLDEFMHDFHLSREEALRYIAQGRATQLILDELLVRGRAMPPGQLFCKTTSPEMANHFTREGFGVEQHDGHTYVVTTPRHLS